RFVGSTGTQVDLLLQPWEEARVFNLGPDTEQAQDLWFAYVMSILSLIRPTTHYVRDGVFSPLAVVSDLQMLPANTQAFIVGPPILFLHLLDFMEYRHLRLDLSGKGLIVTAGGWKRFNDEAISREVLSQRLVQRLGLVDAAQVRDAFNMVELNTVL